MMNQLSFFIALFAASVSACITFAQDARPNIILFIADDVSWNDYGCYGNPMARTPNIDHLAESGLRFDNAFLTASSCSPSRASIVTGRYPHNNGKAAELHLPIARHLPWFPELLRQSGYYTALSGKNHMSVAPPDAKSPPGNIRPQAFDLVDGGRIEGNSGGHANWVAITRERPKDKPFFFWFAAYDAHRDWDADNEWKEEYGPMHSADKVVVPPFLIDSPSTRADLASYYNEVTRFDYYIGRVVGELKKQGELDNTLILVMADNGRPFPRAKTRLHDSGMKTALVAHCPSRIKRFGSTASLVSAIDIAPTILAMADVKVPPTMQGISMEPIFNDPQKAIREYAFSEHNWHDYEAHGRSVRDGQFLYIKNNRPYMAWQGPADSVRSESHRDLLASRDQGTLNSAQADVFLAPRPAEELYLASDTNQLRNLIADGKYRHHLERLRRLLANWTEETADTVPERISADSFDRITGNQLKGVGNYRFTTPGEELNASKVNRSGPR